MCLLLCASLTGPAQCFGSRLHIWLLCELELNRCSFKCSAAARDYYLCHREAAVVVCTALDLFSQEFSSKALQQMRDVQPWL